MRFQDFITLQRGFDLPKTEMQNGPYPVVGSTSIIGFHDKCKVDPPGVVMGRSGSLGTIQLIKEPFWPHNTSLWVKDFKGNDPLFVYYRLQGFNFSQFNAGAGVPTLNRNHLDSLEVEVPSLPIQQRIAGILSTYDDLIENNTRRIKILEEMAQVIYREWFVHFRFPGHEKVKMVDSPLGEIPQGWEVCSLRNVADLITRGISPRYNESSQNLVLNQKCIRDFRLDPLLARRHDTRVPKEKYVAKGDVVINSTGVGTLGRVAQLQFDIPDCTVDSHVTIVRPKETEDPDYFGLNLYSLQSHFERQGRGATGQTELGRDVIADTPYIQPPKHLQFDFGKIVRPIRTLSAQLNIKNDLLRRTRDLLLPKLISGEVDVEGLDISVET